MVSALEVNKSTPPKKHTLLTDAATNVFWRQVRNFVLDMTAIPASSAATGIHWPTAQATSLQNIVFQMSNAKGTQHQGIFMEGGKSTLF